VHTVDRCWLVSLPYLVSMVSVIRMELISCPEGPVSLIHFGI